MYITDVSGTTTLSNGVRMPYFGLGVYSMNNEEVTSAVHRALETGYRLIDTASVYGNEEGVGKAVRESDLPREEVFVTSKVWNTDQGYERTLKAFDKSMNRLGLDYLDLYLIHWPVSDLYKDTWKALEKLYNEGRIRAIGVSNFLIHHLKDLMEDAEITPMVNQVEFHPHLVQQELHDFCQKNQIQSEAWAPLMRGKVNEIPLLKGLAEKYEKTPAQIVLRWDLQKGVATIPKSSNPERIRSNADIFDFELSEGDVKRIDDLEQGGEERVTGEHPDQY
ncbi:MAG: aldo/keto reductase [Bacteroidales bacterium]|nr:aldo/keto reductase [Bacteroidales bacterium]